MKSGHDPGGSDFENRAKQRRTAVKRGSIKIAVVAER
jgi:hypothetical protein